MLREARIALRRAEAEATRAPLWRRPGAKDLVALANRDADRAAERHALAEVAAAPYKTMVREAEEHLRAAENLATTERLRKPLEQLSWKEPTRTPAKSRDLVVGLEL